jgi:hypothetical protein
MNSAGIDYGMGKTNVDPETGLRYGVITIRSLDYWIYEQLELVYPEPELDEDGETIEDEFCESIGQVLKTDEYEAHDAFDQSCLFITKSPYYTLTDFCSPCAPGAGDLNSPNNDGVETLCFGHDMFENMAPYPVYSVATRKIVEPPTN